MMNYNDNEYIRFLHSLLRSDFKSFVIKVFDEVASNSIYLDNWHIDVICFELEKLMNNKSESNRLIINIPPRYMKSVISSVAYPAFILGHNPKAEIICVSYADDLATKFALDCKRVMETAWYKQIFPGTILAKDKKATNDFTTTKGGGRYATSVNGTLTGRGADYIIIDDPIKPQDTFSDTIRDKTNQWYGNTLYSRLNNKNTGKIIVIMQRLHDEDFTGYLLATDELFRHIKIQAIAENDEIWTIPEPHSGKKLVIRRRKGEALHPERESIDSLLKAKAHMGIFNFSGQYQQNPVPIDGAIIKREWLHFYNPKELKIAIDEETIEPRCIIQSWDTANKVGEHNDYSACVTLLYDNDGNYYLLDSYRAKLDFPSLLKKVKNRYESANEKYKCRVLLYIEDCGSGTQLIQALKDKNIKAKEIKAEHDKETRLMSVSYLLENGTCLFPNDNPGWWIDFENELLRFPKAKHDDQCDALSQALATKPSFPGSFKDIQPLIDILYEDRPKRIWL